MSIFKEINSSFKYKTSIVLFFLIIISFPVSDKIFLFLRLQDFFILLFISINFFLLNKLEIKFLLITFLILLFTNIIGYITFDNFYYQKIAIFYKILIPIIFFFQIDKIINKNNFLSIEKFIDYTVVIFLSILFFGYKYKLNFIDLPVLPGSLVISDQYSNDRHLISLLICIYISFKFISNMGVKKHFENFILLIIFYIMMNLFNSRVFGIFLLVLIYLQLNEIFISKKLKKIWQFLLYFFVIFLLFSILSYDFKLLRIFNFYELNVFKNLINYQTLDVGPHANRITSFFWIVPENLLLLFTGFGFIHYKYLFLDSGLIFLITTFGILPLFYLTLYINKNFNYFSDINFPFALIFLVAIFMNLVVAEFFLVSRFIFVTLILFKISSIKSKLFTSNHEDKKYD